MVHNHNHWLWVAKLTGLACILRRTVLFVNFNLILYANSGEWFNLCQDCFHTNFRKCSVNNVFGDSCSSWMPLFKLTSPRIVNKTNCSNINLCRYLSFRKSLNRENFSTGLFKTSPARPTAPNCLFLLNPERSTTSHFTPNVRWIIVGYGTRVCHCCVGFPGFSAGSQP